MNDFESIIVEVASLDEAKNIGAAKWSISTDDVVAKIIEEEKSFFGFLGRKLTVEIQPVFSLSLLRARNIVDDLLKKMELEVEASTEDDDVLLNISGHDAGIVIGRHGETIKAFEYLVNLMLREDLPHSRVRLDSDGYRERRTVSLQRLALSASRKTLRRNRPTYLEPMTSWERRVIHITLKDCNDVDTRSVGEDPERKVVIYPSSRSGNY